MFRQRHTLRKNQALCTNASCRSFVFQIALNRWAFRNKPQYTAIHLLEDPHPNIINIRCDLVIGIEATKDEALLWQSYFRTRKPFIRYGALTVSRLETIWQIDNLFRIEIRIDSLGSQFGQQ